MAGSDLIGFVMASRRRRRSNRIWEIENGLHYRRDETPREDWCHLKRGQAPRAMAVINNLIMGLTLRWGWANLAAARRYFDAHPHKARRLVFQRLADF